MGFFNKYIIHPLLSKSLGKKSLTSNPYLGMCIEANESDVIADEQFRIGVAYQNGAYMLPQDNKKALEYYRKAAERGHAVAQLFMVMGLMRYNDDHNEEVMSWLQKAASQGERQAMYNLAISYHRGDVNGMPDIEFSLKLFRKSAEKLYGPACARMAHIYANGEDGVKPNKAIAKLWALEANNYGDRQDAAILGHLLEEGDVIDGNLNWHKIYQEAGEAGEPFAWHVMGNAYINEDIDKASSYWQKAVDMDCNPAKYNLARYQQSKDNKDIALKLFEESAEWGKEESYHALAEIYYYGDGVEKNIPKALEYNEKALNLGYTPARYLLALMCLRNSLNEILPDKVMRGISYMEQAAQDKYPLAIQFFENQQRQQKKT